MTPFTPSAQDASKRLDHFLQEKLPEHSRSRIQAWIKDGHVTVNGGPVKASQILHGGEHIEVTPSAPPPLKATAEDLPVEILYEDFAVVAVNKPAGLVVHAGAGVHEGTLVNRLVHHFQDLSQGGQDLSQGGQGLSQIAGDLRPGIVHRLDRGTSGVILVARTDSAHRALAAQFSGRSVEKMYLALVQGHVRDDAGRIDKPIARDPVHRTRMTARLASGRSALTEYRVLERLDQFTYLEVRIGTGRTHQIRVHLSNIGHPVAGDNLYGARAAERIFLHAARISFNSPAYGERVTVEAPLPADLQQWLVRLREARPVAEPRA